MHRYKCKRSSRIRRTIYCDIVCSTKSKIEHERLHFKNVKTHFAVFKLSVQLFLTYQYNSIMWNYSFYRGPGVSRALSSFRARSPTNTLLTTLQNVVQTRYLHARRWQYKNMAQCLIKTGPRPSKSKLNYWETKENANVTCRFDSYYDKFRWYR